MDRGFKGVWIPASVWLSEDLSLQEKVFLVEIDSLDNEYGCFANNKHFSKFFGLSERRAQQVISQLKEKGYISVEFKTQNKQIVQRIIRIKRPPYPGEENFTPSRNFLHHPHEESFTHNNTIPNNTKENIDRYIEGRYSSKVSNTVTYNSDKEIKEQSQKPLPPPPKSPYCESGNVFLSDDEYKSLLDRYGTTATESYIGQLDRYMQKDFAIKARYARRNHYAVVVDWIEKDRVKKKVTTKVDIEQPFIPSSELPNDDWKDFISTADLIKMGYKF